MSSPSATPAAPEEFEAAPVRPRLHQPWRALVAVAEVVAAVLLVLGAVWAWQRGLVPMELPNAKTGAPPYQLTRYEGPWLGLAALLALLAALAVVDAVRQLVLAVRTRGRRRA
ncbi:hypothetical protein JOF53_004888 [Crossiella equi]|uniref:Uncharacterized protein n=1 Tax=Crossiella equi TaxID=130796 RepID=A0ABS5AI33_9PSEU|nr:hypothetical protein [Crossiella equi]MBP2476016.1 hypothetical protein [Crossiella equi]